MLVVSCILVSMYNNERWRLLQLSLTSPWIICLEHNENVSPDSVCAHKEANAISVLYKVVTNALVWKNQMRTGENLKGKQTILAVPI